MDHKTAFSLWAAVSIVCAGLGFIPDPQGALRVLLTVLSLLVFLPPLFLLRCGMRRTVKRICALSLGLTVLFMVLNIVTAPASSAVGTFMHIMLGIVSVPMFCCGYWALSLFLWACLLIASLQKPKKTA